MATVMYTPKDIFEHEFKTSMRGFDKKEVDEFLDDVIKDYEIFTATIEELRKENAKLKEAAQHAPASSVAAAAPQSTIVSRSTTTATTATNFDILKRISRLEKEVFGKQIVE